MSVRLQLVGKTFGRLTVTEFAGSDKRGRAIWSCVCQCGKTKNILGSPLVQGKVVSCGCFHKEQNKAIGLSARVHGHACCADTAGGMSRVYKTWLDMKQRCTNPNVERYPCYGGRGIVVCDRWRHSFPNFLEDMGEKLKGMSIDRIDVNGNYEPSNCRWATASEQNANRRPYKMKKHVDNTALWPLAA